MIEAICPHCGIICELALVDKLPFTFNCHTCGKPCIATKLKVSKGYRK